MQDRACDLAYANWRLTPIYDPDPLSEGVEGIDDGAKILEDPGRESFDFLVICRVICWQLHCF